MSYKNALTDVIMFSIFVSEFGIEFSSHEIYELAFVICEENNK